MADLPAALLRSITWDQGTEMARHLTITRSLGAPVYFCDSHSPWQRGSNENTNGLLRDYFPKGTDLSTHSPQHLLAVENELNNRPQTRPQRPRTSRALRRAASLRESVRVATLTRTRPAARGSGFKLPLTIFDHRHNAALRYVEHQHLRQAWSRVPQPLHQIGTPPPAVAHQRLAAIADCS